MNDLAPVPTAHSRPPNRRPPERNAWVRRALPFAALGLVGLSAIGMVAAALAAGGMAAAVGTVTLASREAAPAGSAPAARAETEPVGAWYPSAPDHLELETPPPPSVEAVRRHLEAGDAERALRDAERFVAVAPGGRERDAALVAVGVLQAERGRANLASEAFADARKGKGPLESVATWLQAEQDAARGQHADAVSACEAYRKRWPKGEHGADCLRVLASSHAALGNVGAARSAAAAYDAEHSTGKISEQISLQLGNQLAEEDPTAAIPLYRALAVDHSAALAGRTAEAKLAQLLAAGYRNAIVPDDAESKMRRAVSLRESGRRDEAWSAFAELRRTPDPRIQSWVEQETESFGWQCQRWDFLVDWYDAEFSRTGDAEVAWSRYRVLARQGRFDEAATLGLQMIERSGTGHWRKAEEELGRTLMLAKRYEEAREQYDQVVGRGGWSGRRAAFSAGFAAYMAKDHEDAVRRFSAILASDGDAVEARYWRSRSLLALDRKDEAASDRALIRELRPWSWYASLVGLDDPDLPTVEPYARTARWAGPDALPDPGPEVLSLAVAREEAPPIRQAPSPVSVGDAPARPGFASWTAPASGESRALTLFSLGPVDPVEDGLADSSWELEPPSSYRPGSLHDPDAARRSLSAFADKYAKKWPELQQIHDLASVGLYDLSGPRMSDWYDLWRQQLRARDRDARQLSAMPLEAWRELFLAARDHHNTARNLYGWWDTLTDPAQREEAVRLGYPLAHDRYVWTHAREHDLDPYLVLGLMRQESTYKATARSRVGARGAMQIMPRTGHLLADLAEDAGFDAGDLEDPTVSVGYGIRYLGLLMDRFSGVYPLAVASYNGGPFNVSTWMTGTGMDMPIDELVEHIPYPETRDYVKKVSEGYAAYIDLYAPESSALLIPTRPATDRREVVDF